jgi:two-component system, chemotaxis family, protein-glutamate methylesterase/glutaminase
MTRRIVVIGASAGGFDAVRRLAADLPLHFPAPVAVVVHAGADSPGILARVLSERGRLPAVIASDGMSIEKGRIHIAPVDRHLLIEPGRFCVSSTPRVNRFRPAIDPLFQSAAQIYGPGAIGIVLTGDLDDGTAGLWAIKRLGGVTIAQDPAEALFPSMPSSAIRHVGVDYIAPLAQMVALLIGLLGSPLDAESSDPGGSLTNDRSTLWPPAA